MRLADQQLAMPMEANRRLYEKPAISARYARQSALQPAEAAILRRYAGEISARRILDLGVGGGRTTPFLLELSRDYVGVDYSGEMIERCRRRFPGVRFEHADARDLSRFADGSFDFILFSYNGIDAVGHADRLTIFAEVRRVLADSGLFVVSSHNRNFPIPRPWAVRHLAVNPVRHPVGFACRCAAYLAGIRNYRRNAASTTATDEYCTMVDSAYRYSLVHYHIALAAQLRQLERLGFDPVAVVGIDGRPIERHESETVPDPWLQYVCRRQARVVDRPNQS